MSEFRIDQISNQAGTAGPDIAGITTFSSTSGMLMPSGNIPSRYNYGQENIITSNLTLHLDAFNSTSNPEVGTTWYDISGNGNNGTLTGGASFKKNYVEVDGISGYIQTSYQPTINNNVQYTYEIWIKKDNPSEGTSTFTTTASAAIISNYKTSTTPYSIFQLYADGRVTLGERNNISVDSSSDGGNNIWAGGGWKHLCMTASSNRLAAYLNGVKIMETSSRPGGIIQSGQSYVIGGEHLSRFYKAQIAVVRIYIGKGLTDEEVGRNYNAQRYRFGV
jgi:hypothetical protein